LSLVEAASTAAANSRKHGGPGRSAACATISALAPINPIDSGTNDAWIRAGQRELARVV